MQAVAVDLLLQHHGHFPGQHVPDHAARHPRHGAHEHGNQSRGAEVERLLGADHA